MGRSLFLMVLAAGAAVAAPIPAPENFMAAPLSPKEVQLSWTPVSLSASGYTVYRDGKAIGTVTTNAYLDQGGLPEDREACYYVTALSLDKKESEPSQKVCAMAFARKLSVGEPRVRISLTLPGDSEVTFLTQTQKNLWIGNLAGEIVLRDSDGLTPLFRWIGPDGLERLRQEFGPVGLRAGTYFLELERHGGEGVFSQGVSYVVQPLKEDVEPNDSSSEAQEAPLNQIFSGHLGYTGGRAAEDVQDWWKFTLPGRRRVRIQVSVDRSLDLGGYFQRTNQLLKGDGATRLKSWIGPHGEKENSQTVGPFLLGPGTYTLRFYRRGGYGGYQAKIWVSYAQ